MLALFEMFSGEQFHRRGLGERGADRCRNRDSERPSSYIVTAECCPPVIGNVPVYLDDNHVSDPDNKSPLDCVTVH
ncbi:hypothetical protein [Amycolatopsis sp. cmx-11-12]|uniref:hypothetical protein n=1 Tax=Amycolatopsis sp. cmx-11-12 TaxID=2785795 RepID=UPI0039175F2D